MYIAVVQPAPPPPSLLCRAVKLGCPAPVVVSPDALASVLAGSPASALQQPAGMGCAGGCKCGGKCKGLGDTAPIAYFGTPQDAAPAPATSPGFLQQFTNPFGSDLAVLSQQLADLNAQTAAVNSNMASSNWGTWVLVGLGGLGAWYAYKTLSGAAGRFGEVRRVKRAASSKRKAKKARLKAELAAL